MPQESQFVESPILNAIVLTRYKTTSSKKYNFTRVDIGKKYLCDVDLTTNRVGILNILIRIAALLFFPYFWGRFSFSYRWFLPTFFAWDYKRFEIIWIYMHSNVKTHMTLHSSKLGACVVYVRVIDQSTVDILSSHG
jgi:hypothetical protein